MQTFIRVFSSLRLTFPLLAGLALVLAAGGGLLTGLGIDFVDVTLGALRLDFYGSWWFGILMLALMTNLIACTVKRKPWKFWQWGFLVTHMGILTLMTGSIMTYYFKTYGQMRLKEGEQASSFEIEHEKELQVWIDEDPRGHTPAHRFPLAYNPYRRTRPDQVLPLRDGFFVRVLEFLPHVEEQDAYMAADDGTTPALQIEGFQSERSQGKAWLPAGNGVAVGPLEIRFDRLSEAVVENLVAPAGEKGTLWIRADGETKEIDVAQMLAQPFTVGQRQVKILECDDAAGHGGDPSPAVKIEVTQGGKTETYVVATFFPELSPMRTSDRQVATDFEAKLRANIAASRLWFILTKQGLRALALTSSGKKQAVDATVGARVRYPFMQVPFEIKLVQLLEKAVRMPVETRPRKDESMRPAVKLKVSRGEGKSELWLTFGPTMHGVEISGQRLMFAYVPKQFMLDFTVRLDRLRVPNRPGTRQAAKYESDITIFDPAAEGSREFLTGVNYPAVYKGYVFYQAQVNSDEPGGRFNSSVFQVAWDPGKKIIYLGGIMAVSGAIFMFFLKPFLLKLVSRASGATDPPLRDPGILLTLTMCSAGTLFGALLMFMRVPWTGVAVGFLVAGTSLLVEALACTVSSRMTPGRGLQVGQAIATTWVLNTAGLVLFMWVKVLG